MQIVLVLFEMRSACDTVNLSRDLCTDYVRRNYFRFLYHSAVFKKQEALLPLPDVQQGVTFSPNPFDSKHNDDNRRLDFFFTWYDLLQTHSLFLFLCLNIFFLRMVRFCVFCCCCCCCGCSP